jgi:hypothetical protein
VIELKIDTVTIAGNIIESICVVTPAGKPDDVYYEKYGKMRKLLTRGFNIIKINGEVVKRFVGAPKGGNKDIACYCNGDKDAPFVAELFSIKENGQCSRFASCTWNVNGVSTCFLLIGSKKVALYESSISVPIFSCTSPMTPTTASTCAFLSVLSY